MKISKILSAVTAAAMLLTLTACNDVASTSNPLDILNSGSSSSSAVSSGSSSTTASVIASTSSTTSESQIDVSAIPVTPTSDFKYEYGEELGSIIITRYIGDKEDVRIPSVIEGKKVVKILGYEEGETNETNPFVHFFGAFEYCKGVKSVIIPNSVTEIGESAFAGCTGLTNITIPNSVTEIGDYAFAHCSGLTSITIPSSVTHIGSSAFRGCAGLTSITIPDSVTEIGDGAFGDYSGSTSITNPDSFVAIGRVDFNDCTATITYKGKTYTPDNYDALCKAINGN